MPVDPVRASCFNGVLALTCLASDDVARSLAAACCRVVRLLHIREKVYEIIETTGLSPTRVEIVQHLVASLM